jgi:hypothetical protein
MTIEVKFQENVPFIFVFLVDVIAARGCISRDNEKYPENLLCYFFELLRIRMTELRCYDSLGYQLVLIAFHSS